LEVGTDPTRRSETLARGLSVLVAVNASAPVTISQIMQATGLAKATVNRLLATLRAEGFVTMAPGGAGFSPLPKVRLLSSAMALQDPASSAIRTLLAERVQSTKWPLEYLVPDGDWMSIQVTTRNDAPISLRRVEQTRFPMLTSASGVAYLSAQSPKFVEACLARVGKDRTLGADRPNSRLVRQNVAAARLNGFAIRDYFLPAEGSRLVAVPATAGGHLHGCLAMAYLKDAIPHDHVVMRIVPLLKIIAGEIAAASQRYSRGPP
jgi:IclR family mhp operon transcriptional activator